MERYVEIALGSPSSRGRAVPIREIPNLQKHAFEHQLELYRSYYFFDQTLVDHLRVYKTVKGFNGTPFIDMITLDIDKGSDTDERVHQRAIAVFQELKEFDISDINIRPYYSGSGFHFVLPNLWAFKTPGEVKETLCTLFPSCDNIYDKSRIIRVSNTINFKTQRYKIPLQHTELLHTGIEGIIHLAEEPRLEFRFSDFDENSSLESTKVNPKFVMSQQPKMVEEDGLSPVITCMQKLYNLPPQEGSRHTSMLRMISAFKRNGVPRSGIETMMMSWTAGGMEIGEIRKIVSDVFAKGYQYSCQDQIMAKHCDSRCIFYTKKSYNSAIPKDMTMMEDEMKQSNTADLTKSIELGTILQIKNSFLIAPEEFIVIQGDTGLGKSALAQNILVASTNLKCLYLNFEVGERLMYRRSLQIAYGKTKFDIIQHYSDPNAPTLSEAVKHIHMVSDRINLNTLEQLLTSGAYDIVVADTLECFITPGIMEITPKTEHIAHELKRLAKKYRTILMAIHHISKASIVDASGGQKKLNVHSGKGSSAIEQEADKVILLEGRQNDTRRRISSAKARDEAPFDTVMTFDAERTFRFIREKVWTSDQDFSASSKTNTSTSLGAVKESPSALREGLRLLQ